MKYAVTVKAPVGQGLGIILERIGRRFSPGVIHVERLILFHQHELHVYTSPLDRARLHVSGNPQTLRIGAVPHLVQLFNGDVITLAVLHTSVGKVAEQHQNHCRRSTELQISFRLARHKKPHREKPTLKLYALDGWEARLPEEQITERSNHERHRVPQGKSLKSFVILRVLRGSRSFLPGELAPNQMKRSSSKPAKGLHFSRLNRSSTAQLKPFFQFPSSSASNGGVRSHVRSGFEIPIFLTISRHRPYRSGAMQSPAFVCPSAPQCQRSSSANDARGESGATLADPRLSGSGVHSASRPARGRRPQIRRGIRSLGLRS